MLHNNMKSVKERISTLLSITFVLILTFIAYSIFSFGSGTSLIKVWPINKDCSFVTKSLLHAIEILILP